MTLLESMVVLALFGILLTMAIPPTLRDYARSRSARDASARVAQDIALLERVAQDGGAHAGATLIITSPQPLNYACYRGRPAADAPGWRLGDLIVQRSFPDVSLAAGSVGQAGALLFARNGSVQVKEGDVWVDQHQTLTITLVSGDQPAASANVDLNLFTGGVILR